MPLQRRSPPQDYDRSGREQRSGQIADTADSWVTHLRSPTATDSLGQAVGRKLRGGDLIALTGELGAGKTHLVKGIAAGAGIDPEQVTSPTFTFIHEYSGQIRLIHADLYRLTNHEEIRYLGLEEYPDESCAVVIEWADRMGPDFPQDFLSIHLEHAQRSRRQATLQCHGPRSRALLQMLSRERLP